MTWRTGTRNPHTLYLDEGETSLPQGFIMNPGAARAIVEAMNEQEAAACQALNTAATDRELLTRARDELRIWLRQMSGIGERNATADSMRLDPLILALDERLRKAGK